LNDRPAQPITSKEANFAADGRVIMPIDSLFNFLVRALLQLVIFIISQVHHFEIRVDSEAFLASFSMGDPANSQHPEPWGLAPGWRRQRMPDGSTQFVSNAAAREEAFSRMKDALE